VDKEIQVHLSRYAHRKSVQCDLVLAPDMELLAEDCRVKHPAFPVVQLKPEGRMQIVRYLAQECLKLWVIIVTRTRSGRDSPQEFEVRDFVEPALQLLQEGFRVSRAEMETEVRRSRTTSTVTHVRFRSSCSSPGACSSRYPSTRWWALAF